VELIWDVWDAGILHRRSARESLFSRLRVIFSFSHRSNQRRVVRPTVAGLRGRSCRYDSHSGSQERTSRKHAILTYELTVSFHPIDFTSSPSDMPDKLLPFVRTTDAAS